MLDITINRPLEDIVEKNSQNHWQSFVTYSIPWPDVSLIGFLQQAANAPRIYWESEKSAVAFAGSGMAARLTAHNTGRFQSIRQQAQHLFANIIPIKPDTPAPAGPRLFGGFAFGANYQPKNLWSAFPAACFILPRYQLTRYQGQVWLTINHPLGPNDDRAGLETRLQNEAQRLKTMAVTETTQFGPATNKPLDIKDLMDSVTWHQQVTNATQRIRRGELDKVVLARARQMRSARPVEPANVLARLKQKYPNCYRFLFEPIPGHAFYGATPELLAKVSGSALRTVALAGSIKRGQTPEEDAMLGQQLLDTPKEQIEHAHVVDAIRENLAPLVTDMHVAPQPGLCRLSNIQHIQTPIEARLAEGLDTLDVVEALHPTPALGGRPRHVALPIINQAEPFSRGWYGAPVGWLDSANNGMFAVAIRSAVSVGEESMLYAGAGIVADSVPDKEWRETELKFKPLIDALNGSKPF